MSPGPSLADRQVLVLVLQGYIGAVSNNWHRISTRRRGGYYARMALAMLGGLLSAPGSAAVTPTDPRRERVYAEQRRRERGESHHGCRSSAVLAQLLGGGIL